MKNAVDSLMAAGLVGLLVVLSAGRPATATAGAHQFPDARPSSRTVSTESPVLSGRLGQAPGYVPWRQEEETERTGRLGGKREGFLAVYGPPALYLGPDVLVFGTEGEERIIVTFARDRAVQIVVLPDRPGDKPSIEPDPGDWTLDTASAVFQRFVPLDMEIEKTHPARVVDGVVFIGCSAALEGTVAGEASDSNVAYTVRYTMPTDETVSAIRIALGEPRGAGAGSSVSPAQADGDDRASASSSRAVSEQNGIRVTFLGFDADAEGTGCLATGENYIAVAVTIENRSDDTLRYDLDDFRVTDTRGRGYAAVAGGAEPAIVSGALAPGDTIRGWISFGLPPDATPAWFVYTRGGSTMRFGLS